MPCPVCWLIFQKWGGKSCLCHPKVEGFWVLFPRICAQIAETGTSKKQTFVFLLQLRMPIDPSNPPKMPRNLSFYNLETSITPPTEACDKCPVCPVSRCTQIEAPCNFTGTVEKTFAWTSIVCNLAVLTFVLFPNPIF